MATPGSAPFTSPGNPTRPKTRLTPTATPGPRGALPGSVPRGATRADADAARQALNEITGRTPEPSRPITESDARQLGLNVSPPSALIDLIPAWVQGYINEASDDELLAIGALEDAGYSTASSLPSSVASTPVRGGRHGDTSREYDGGLSRHAGAAVNDAVCCNPAWQLCPCRGFSRRVAHSAGG